MKKIAVFLCVAIVAITTLSGCEKADYKHPLHRK